MDWHSVADAIASLLVVVISMLLLVLVPILVVRAMRTPPQKRFRRIYDGITQPTESRPGLVFIEFHTYDGFLVWFTQTAHQGYYPPDEARLLLGRLARYNLTWGLFAAGGVFVPILTLINYWSQRRSIKRQLKTDMTI